jgi:lipopolysaccharide/colanic/teichoic acid biosynthesis glycosyltransferase
MRPWQRNGTNEVVARYLIDEDLFNEVLTRERRRSDRSNRPFVLLCLELQEGLAADSACFLEEILDAVAATKRGTDIAGWLEEGALVGVILSDVDASNLSSSCNRIERRLRRELGNRIDANTLETLSIAFHPYPEPRSAGGGQWPIDPILYPDLYQRRKGDLQYDTIKRSLDIVVSLTVLAVLSPLLLFVAGLVRWGSRGPVLFRQVRIGRMAKPFTMLKFRTMYTSVDDKVHQDYINWFIKGDGQVHDPHENRVFKLTKDRRVTRIGGLLRKTSLDELPQLWNVLRGDMSLVGPRPPLPYELEQYDPWHRCRVLEAKPGITGLWQVTGRSRTTFGEMVRLDLRYIRTRSLWTDIKILLATPAAALLGKGAY